MRSHRNRILILLGVIALLFLVTWNRRVDRSPSHRWAAALVLRDYETLERLTVGIDFSSLQTDIERLHQQHGTLESYSRNGNYFTFTWEDSFTRCVEIANTSNGTVQPLSERLQPCSGSNMEHHHLALRSSHVADVAPPGRDSALDSGLDCTRNQGS